MSDSKELKPSEQRIAACKMEWQDLHNGRPTKQQEMIDEILARHILKAQVLGGGRVGYYELELDESRFSQLECSKTNHQYIADIANKFLEASDPDVFKIYAVIDTLVDFSRLSKAVDPYSGYYTQTHKLDHPDFRGVKANIELYLSRVRSDKALRDKIIGVYPDRKDDLNIILFWIEGFAGLGSDGTRSSPNDTEDDIGREKIGQSSREKKEVVLSPEVEEFLASLNPDIPLVFREQARQAATYIQELDNNPETASPEAKRFADELAGTGFIWHVYGEQIYGKLWDKQTAKDPLKILPKWLYKDLTGATTSYDAEKAKKISAAFDKFTKKRGLIGRNKTQGTYYQIDPPGEELPVAKRYKFYVEDETLLPGLESGNIGKILNELISLRINPDDMKLSDADRLVFYSDHQIENFDRVQKVFAKYGITVRGPAQDPEVIRLEDGILKSEVDGSNDTSLGEAGRNPFKYDVGPIYSPRKFLESYLKMCLYNGKNPAWPYTISFSYLINYGEEIPRVKINEFIRQAERMTQQPVYYTRNKRTFVDKLTLTPEERQRKETDWQPAVKPVEVVFPHVINELTQTKRLSLETKRLLYAWAGQVVRLTGPDGKSHNIHVNQLIDGQGGIPLSEQQAGRLPKLGHYLEAVSSFLQSRANSGVIKEEDLELLGPWADCPKRIGQGQMIKDLVAKIRERLMETIQEKSQELSAYAYSQ